MYKRSSASSRLLPLFLSTLIGVFVVLCLGYLLYRYTASSYTPKGRYSLVFFGDPIEIASYEPVTRRWTIVQFPVETTIRGVRGYGDYRLAGLWKLAATEATPSGVVLESITDEFAVPMDRYIYKKSSPFVSHSEQQLLLPSLSGIGGVFQYLRGEWDHKIPLSEFLALSRLVAESSNGPIQVYRLKKGNGLMEKVALDGSMSVVIDREAVDRITKDAFEDVSLRKERIRIAVFNTTSQPSLGSRVARILSKMGGNVVSVGNDTQEISRCLLEGKSDVIESYTAQLIKTLLSCDPVTVQETEQGDLIIRLGTDYARRFVGK